MLLTESSTTNTVTVGSNLVYTITLFNAGADAANVQLTDLLAPTLTYVGSSITNPPGGTFTSPVFSNGIITTGATNFGSNQTLVLVVTTTPTVAGLITNITTVISSTPDTDPTGTNRTAQVVNTAVAPASLHADVGLTMRAQPNPVMLSNQLVYFLTVTNSGPVDAPDVVLDDPLPLGELFVSASNSQGSFILTALALTWDLGPIANHGSADVSIVVTPQTAGLATNIALVAIGSGGAVTDTNHANDSATVVTTVSAPALTNVSVQALGPITFNPQTGLFEQTVQFQNLSSNAATAVRVSVVGLPANIVLYNASGSSSGVPFVEYDLPVAAGGSVNFLLEYYEASRKAFTSSNFTATAVVATSPVAPGGTILQLDQTPTLHNGVVLIEFTSTPGATYVIEYSSDTVNWNVAAPPIKAAGTRTQWLDSGPPNTASMPASVGQRYYRVVQTSPAP